MDIMKHGQAPEKVGFLTLASRQVPQVHQVLHRQVVVLRQFSGDEFFDLGPQLRLPSNEGIEMFLPGDGGQTLPSIIIFSR